MSIEPRHTKQRQAVLRTVKFSPSALSAEQVLSGVKKLWPDIGLATVYRNLDFLTKRGEIYEFEGENGTKQYIGHSSHRAVFRCQRCGQIQEMSVTADTDMWKRNVVFISKLSAQGLCASCAKILQKA